MQKMVNNGSQADYVQKARLLAHNDWSEFLKLYAEYLTDHKKFDSKVVYEYVRVATHFLKPLKQIPIDADNIESTQAYVRGYLDKIDNPNTYRNTLASIKNLFDLLARKGDLSQFKYKRVMPSFSIRTPSLEDMRKFGQSMTHQRTQVYYYLGCVSAIRPQHLLKLRKRHFDTKNNMINTWQKTYGKKNFFFSFYTDEVKPLLEDYLAQLSHDSLLFPYGYRFVQDEFERASKRSNIKMTPKMMRKFATNWLRRHGMIPEDVNLVTGHTPQSIVAKHYLDISRIHESYNEATQDLKLLTKPETQKEPDQTEQETQPKATTTTQPITSSTQPPPTTQPPPPTQQTQTEQD